MTNAEKYLKDGLENIESLIQDYFHFIGCIEDSNRYNTIYQFFLNEAKPTLTEDERVILRNLHEEYKHIRRNEMGNLYIGVDYFGMYDNLFQFIKNGEEYEIEELLK